MKFLNWKIKAIIFRKYNKQYQTCLFQIWIVFTAALKVQKKNKKKTWLHLLLVNVLASGVPILQ